jgi:hypothetical protein
MTDQKKPTQGAWDAMQKKEFEKKERVKWGSINEEHELLFAGEPREVQLKDKNEVFYVFDVKENGVEKEIATSAQSLLQGLKNNSPLKDKRLRITKKMGTGKSAGRQYFDIVDLDNPVEELVQ